MFKTVCLLVVSLFLLSGTPVFAQSKENVGLPWDALIEFSGGSVAAGIGFSWGSGTLTQAGKTYSLKIDGLSVGSVGITKASAYGKVFHLNELSDINGTYAAIGTGAIVGGGGSAIAMRNKKGVVIMDDTWHGALGVQYRIAKPWLLSLGFAYDSWPVSLANRSPSLPLDRTWRGAAGVQYDWSQNLTLGFAYEYINAGSASINKTGSPLLGDLVGDYSPNMINVVNVNLI